MVRDADGEVIADLVVEGDRWLAGPGRAGRPGQRPLPVQPAPGPGVRRAGRARRGALARPRAEADGRRGAGGFPERRQEHADLPDLGGQAEDRRLPLHHPRAPPGRGPLRRARVRGGRHPGLDRGGERGHGASATGFSATSSGPGRWSSCSTWPRPTVGRPAEQERILLEELRRYQPELLARPRLVVGSKADAAAAGRRLGRRARLSALTGEGLRPLLGRMARMVDEARAELPAPPPLRRAPARAGRGGRRAGVRRRLAGAGPAGRAGGGPVRPHQRRGLAYAQGRLRGLGVDRALARAGARAGDRVRIGGFEFDYEPDEHGPVTAGPRSPDRGQDRDLVADRRPRGAIRARTRHRQAVRRGGRPARGGRPGGGGVERRHRRRPARPRPARAAPDRPGRAAGRLGRRPGPPGRPLQPGPGRPRAGRRPGAPGPARLRQPPAVPARPPDPVGPARPRRGARRQRERRRRRRRDPLRRQRPAGRPGLPPARRRPARAADRHAGAPDRRPQRRP